MRGIGAMACVLFALVISTGCAQTRHVMSVDKSGFLGEELYAKMTKGDESKLEAALRWVDYDAAKQGEYTKLLLDPIVLYRKPQHGGRRIERTQPDFAELLLQQAAPGVVKTL
jgi:hypothetical protein